MTEEDYKELGKAILFGLASVLTYVGVGVLIGIVASAT